MTEQITSLVEAARQRLARRAPFFGHLAGKLELVAADAVTPTVGTDGKHLYVNGGFFGGLTAKQQEGTLAVVAFKLNNNIIERCGERDPMLWNLANDYVANLSLRVMGEELPAVAVYDERFAGKSTEEVYDILAAEGEKKAIELRESK